MKELNKCQVRNCIPTPTGCLDWDGGDIPYLGICNGDPLPSLLWEIVKKLQELSGEDLTQFDLDGLLDICNTKAPQEVTLINILNVVKQNQFCLKDYIDGLAKQLSEILNQSKTNIDLKCYQEFDNLGNGLTITRDQLDQLVINNLCSQKELIDTLSGKVTNLQNQVDNFKPVVEEPSFSTCVDTIEKPTSSQVKSIATAHCNLNNFVTDKIGNSTEISTNVGKLADPDVNWDLIFAGNPNWKNITEGLNMAETEGALSLIVRELWKKVKFMEDNCCAVTCDDIKLGFTLTFDETGNTLLIKFTSGAGTNIPSGIVDKGSTGTIKDIDGTIEYFNLVIANNATIEVPVLSLNKTGDFVINISAKMGNDSITCEKCLSKSVKPSALCNFCEFTATDKVTIIYKQCSI